MKKLGAMTRGECEYRTRESTRAADDKRTNNRAQLELLIPPNSGWRVQGYLYSCVLASVLDRLIQVRDAPEVSCPRSRSVAASVEDEYCTTSRPVNGAKHDSTSDSTSAESRCIRDSISCYAAIHNNFSCAAPRRGIDLRRKQPRQRRRRSQNACGDLRGIVSRRCKLFGRRRPSGCGGDRRDGTISSASIRVATAPAACAACLA